MAGVGPRFFAGSAPYEQLKDQVGEPYLVGDARSPRKAYEAIHEGFRVGMEI